MKKFSLLSVVVVFAILGAVLTTPAMAIYNYPTSLPCNTVVPVSVELYPALNGQTNVIAVTGTANGATAAVIVGTTGVVKFANGVTATVIYNWVGGGKRKIGVSKWEIKDGLGNVVKTSTTLASNNTTPSLVCTKTGW